MRLLHRARHQGEILEAVIAAAIGADGLGPGELDDVEALGEAVLALLVGDAVGVVGARERAATDAENQPAAADLVDRRGLLGEAQRVREGPRAERWEGEGRAAAGTLTRPRPVGSGTLSRGAGEGFPGVISSAKRRSWG